MFVLPELDFCTDKTGIGSGRLEGPPRVVQTASAKHVGILQVRIIYYSLRSIIVDLQ